MSKLFVITGATGGLGMALLKAALGRELTIEGVGRSATSADWPDGTPFTQMDCTDAEAVNAYWQQIRGQYGVDTPVVLVNNAGKFHRARFDATEMETVERIVADNFLTSITMSRGFLDHYESGTIVNLNSFAGLRPRADLSVYGAAKAALKHFYASLRLELPPGKFRIMNLHPYRVNTWSDDDEPGTIDKDEAARWIIEMALLEGSFEIADCTLLPVGAELPA